MEDLILANIGQRFRMLHDDGIFKENDIVVALEEDYIPYCCKEEDYVDKNH